MDKSTTSAPANDPRDRARKSIDLVGNKAAAPHRWWHWLKPGKSISNGR